MNPIRFGPTDQQLFGVHHPPTGDPLGSGVLLFNPLGQEAIRCHRLFRVLADQLARAGFDVMRFDYHGTGESAGDDADGDLEYWYRDSLLAHAELLQRSRCLRVSWLGLRLGASIAAVASAACDYPLQHLLLWDPILDGGAYLQQMKDAHINARREGFGARWARNQGLREMTHREAENEVLGFAIPTGLRTQIQQLSVPLVATADARLTSLLATTDYSETRALQESMQMKNKKVQLHRTDTSINWMSNEAMDSSIVPPASMKLVITLLTDNQ